MYVCMYICMYVYMYVCICGRAGLDGGLHLHLAVSLSLLTHTHSNPSLSFYATSCVLDMCTITGLVGDDVPDGDLWCHWPGGGRGRGRFFNLALRSEVSERGRVWLAGLLEGARPLNG